jgi:hypothetical protein
MDWRQRATPDSVSVLRGFLNNAQAATESDLYSKTVTKFFRRVAISGIALFFLIYFGDYLSLRFRIPGNRLQFDTVHVQPYIAVPKKNGQTEFILDAPVDHVCANSLFPHFGVQPCWYLRGHREPRTNL